MQRFIHRNTTKIKLNLKPFPSRPGPRKHSVMPIDPTNLTGFSYHPTKGYRRYSVPNLTILAEAQKGLV